MNTRRGFSLIELALVLGISGLMVGFVLQSQQSAATADCYVSTRMQLADINGAIQRFARVNERLPMPASRSVGVEGPTYGREASGAAIDTVGTTSWGALPFQALGLAPSYASDCWGNKFTYVVTTALTTTGGYLDSTVAGSITLKKDATNTLNTTTAYAVISHGQDALGAVKSNYKSASHGWCVGATLKDINCSKASATLADAPFNNGADAGAAYFDDLIVASGRPQLLNNSNLYCWGTDISGFGFMADNNLTANHYSYTPKKSVGATIFAKMTGSGEYDSNFTRTPCALTGDGTAYCWGRNQYGQIGDGTTTDRAMPTRVNTTTKFKKIFPIALGNTNCGIAKDDTAWCWGHANGSIPSSTPVVAPYQMSNVLTFSKLIGYASKGICGLALTGDVYCIGSAYQHFGNGPTTYSYSNATFAIVPGGRKFAQIEGPGPICGLTSAADPGGAGKIYCWGTTDGYSNASGAGSLALSPLTITDVSNLASGSITYTPGSYSLSAGDCVFVQNVTGAVGVNYNTYCVTAGNFVSNKFILSGTNSGANAGAVFTPVDTTGVGTYTGGGQLVPVSRNVPTLIDGVGGITFSKLVSNSAAISTTGQLYSWGSNYSYQLGVSGAPARFTPIAIASTTNANPAVFTTTAAHGLTTGDAVYFSNSSFISTTAQDGSAGTITLAASDSAVDNFYNGQRIIITNGPAAGNVRTAMAYTGASKILQINVAWSATPTTSSQYLIGTPKSAQGGTSTSLTLNASDAQPSGYYVGQTIGLIAGAGQSQYRVVTAYDGPTNTATVSSWSSPNASTTYLIGTPKFAQGGDNTQSITLAASASAVDGYYNGLELRIPSIGNTVYTVGAYNGTTKVATLTGTLASKPDSTSTYTIGTTPLYKYFYATVLSPTTFRIADSLGVVYDSSRFSAFSASGFVYRVPNDGTCIAFTAGNAGTCAYTPVAATQTYGGVPFTVSDANVSVYPYVAQGSNGLYGWGVNSSGSSVGDGTALTRVSMVPISTGGVNLMFPVYRAGTSVCMLSDVSDAYCWSINAYGQLGDGTTAVKTVPTLVSGSLKWTSLNFLGNTSISGACGIVDDPTLNCAAQTVNWGTGCTGNIPASNNGDASSVSNTAVGFTGNVTATCVEGTIQQSNATCM